MKRIIMDHYRRWGWLIAAILAAYYFIMVGKLPALVRGVCIFQAVMWLGFLLMIDLSRGLPRVLNSLPVTNKQIGRAWLLAAVVFPAVALGVTGCGAILIFSGGTNLAAAFKDYLTDWSLTAVFLGAMFGALTLGPNTPSESFAERIRTCLGNALLSLPLIGFLFVQNETASPIFVRVIFAGCAIMSVLGWFRAERMVVQRAGFRSGARSAQKRPGQHRITYGFGGLPYLFRRAFVRVTFFGFLVLIWMIGWMPFLSHGQSSSRELAPMMSGYMTPFIFVVIISLAPVVYQMRLLRSLPVSPSVLSATLVILPVTSITALGALFAGVAFAVGGKGMVLHTASDFLRLGGTAALMVSLIVWRGLDTMTYLLIVLLMIFGSFVTLALTSIFHLAKTPKNPLWLDLAAFFLCIVGSYVLTRALLTKSSNPYRARAMPASAWSMVRG